MGDGDAAGRALLGFCPQQDPLLELLTAREHLSLYARLKARPQHYPPCHQLLIPAPRKFFGLP